MYSVTRLLDVAEVDRDRVLAAVRADVTATGARRQLVEPTLPGVRNGGDILVHLRFDTEDQWRSVETDFVASLTDPAVTRVNGVGYSGGASPSIAQSGTVYRALLLRVLPGCDARTVARFEDELRLMPRYVNTIAAWQLSRVDEPIGTSEWTHVFEQEFTDVDGLMGPYLMHPIHWAVVDRWFDPESPDVIIRDRVCHSFCAIGDSVMT
jgi:hypothetical protein